MSRPTGCVYPDCLHCTLLECEYDGIEIDDEAISNAIDSEIIHMRVVEQHYINGTYSTYDSKRRYHRSEKGKAALKKYLVSEKGKEAQKRKAQKDIETGKNAEKCRRYYERHKAEILAKAKAKAKKSEKVTG